MAERRGECAKTIKINLLTIFYNLQLLRHEANHRDITCTHVTVFVLTCVVNDDHLFENTLGMFF